MLCPQGFSCICREQRALRTWCAAGTKGWGWTVSTQDE